MASDTVAPLGKYTATDRRHWAFVPRAHPDIPAFQNPADRAWVKTPVDAFILARLQKEGLKPSPPADRATLIRRVSFDLTGLPPTPAGSRCVRRDRSPDAWEKLVERLLASPHYGERWGQHWLDVVRFAETDGFEYDTHRKDAWRYRDYVIRAFNNDKPYDRFVRRAACRRRNRAREDETLIAAGFNRLGSVRKNAGNQEVASSRNEVLTEMTNIVGSALLGVTLGCARCHDHKFDPIRQSDYYRMQAFFAAVGATTSRGDARRSRPLEGTSTKNADQMKQMKAASKPRSRIGKGASAGEDRRSAGQDGRAPVPSLFSVTDDPAKRSEIHLLARGDYQNKGDRVGMRPLGVLLPDDAPELPEMTVKPRLELANWVVDDQNPLTARVMVNRIWEYHFGRGIVGTPNDFGRMGERPTHPELLDFLAQRIRRNRLAA